MSKMERKGLKYNEQKLSKMHQEIEDELDILNDVVHDLEQEKQQVLARKEVLLEVVQPFRKIFPQDGPAEHAQVDTRNQSTRDHQVGS